ncbi:hypothetical protein FUA23_02885 [Neolewinella aurantiaca]|uniref:Uncharacterized protein n=1 Tax=Neolewinella aurantiaca TaxID=2602767 RepID=A0A5C7FM77_9BACT|nr:hypothetical protein [Neolewinella aurantiaca]TXF91188.1 hypothetical protein FUA23_02885 [Neolewinella aurantiaca]
MSEPAPIYAADLVDPRRKVSLEYFPSLMLLLAAMVIIVYIGVPALFIAGAGDDDGNPVPVELTREFAYYGYWVCGTFLVYVLFVACINRLRSAGVSPWWMLVPGYNIYLLFTAPDLT